MLKGLSAPKLLELRQLVRQLVLDQGRKVVIFSQWRRMLHLAHWAVRDLLAEQGLRAGFFTGAEGQKRRTQNIVEFHDDPDFRILFASDAGGVGLNLQRAANCVINLELPWNPAVLEQRIGRIYRLGQKQPIDVYNLVARRVSSRGSPTWWATSRRSSRASSTATATRSGSTRPARSCPGCRSSTTPRPSAAATAVGGTEEIDLADLADVGLDDEVDDPFEEMIEAGDECATSRSPPPSRNPCRRPIPSGRRDRSRPRPRRSPPRRAGPPCRAWARSASSSPSSRSAATRGQHHHRGPRRGRLDPQRPVRGHGGPASGRVAGRRVRCSSRAPEAPAEGAQAPAGMPGPRRLIYRQFNGTITARKPTEKVPPMPFEPNYRITPRTATHLMRIEAARQAVEDLPITSAVLAGSARPRVSSPPTTRR